MPALGKEWVHTRWVLTIPSDSQCTSSQNITNSTPSNLWTGYKNWGKYTFWYDDTHTLRTNYSLNYNSVSCCKLFRAHKHHSKISLTRNIKKISTSIQSGLGGEGNPDSLSASEWQALGSGPSVRDHLLVTVTVLHEQNSLMLQAVNPVRAGGWMYLIPIHCEMGFIYNAKSGARKLQEWTQLLKSHWGGPSSGHVMGQLAQWLVKRKEKIDFTQFEDTHMHTQTHR